MSFCCDAEAVQGERVFDYMCCSSGCWSNWHLCIMHYLANRKLFRITTCSQTQCPCKTTFWGENNPWSSFRLSLVFSWSASINSHKCSCQSLKSLEQRDEWRSIFLVMERRWLLSWTHTHTPMLGKQIITEDLQPSAWIEGWCKDRQ